MRRVLLDQGLPRAAVPALATAGFDVVHAAELGLARAPDAEILFRAKADGRVCITLDADFHALLATTGAAEPSVVRIRKEGLDAEMLTRLLVSIWPGVEADLDSGAVVTVRDRSVRVRHLPILRA